MHGRQVSKLVKVLFALLLYSLVYIVISIPMHSLLYTFVSDDIRVGDKYILIYLISKRPVFSDAEGAEVFRYRRCGKCFITNNKGFLPISEFDAIAVHGNKSLLSETGAFMDPGKRYVLETPRRCLRQKLVGCAAEPILTSFASRQEFDLCTLCRNLHKEKELVSGFIGQTCDK